MKLSIVPKNHLNLMNCLVLAEFNAVTLLTCSASMHQVKMLEVTVILTYTTTDLLYKVTKEYHQCMLDTCQGLLLTHKYFSRKNGQILF